MSNDSKTYILDDQSTDKDALNFTPFVETLAGRYKTDRTPHQQFGYIIKPRD